MTEPHPPPQYEIAGILCNTLRSFKRRRELRRTRMNEAYAATMSVTGPASSSPQASQRPPPTADGAKLFGATGWVDVGGHAVPVMDDPAKLQALIDQVAAIDDLSPSDLLHVISKASPADAQPGAGTAAIAVPPPEAPTTSTPASPPPAEPVSSASQAPTTIPKSPDMQPEEKHEAATAPAGDEQAAASTAQSSSLAQLEAILARRADEEAARLAALLQEHETRLAEQAEASVKQQAALLVEHENRMAERAEAAAKQQASLLREVMDSHTKQLDAQAARHMQVVRDLLREHQIELDEHAALAAAKEAQAIETLLREHRDVLDEARGAHRQDLEEILEHHRGELLAARKAPATGNTGSQLRELLAEQQAAQTHITSVISALSEAVKDLGQAVAKLADHSAQHQDLFSLPPPSFVPSLPDTTTAFTPPVVSNAAPAAHGPVTPTNMAASIASSATMSAPRRVVRSNEIHDDKAPPGKAVVPIAEVVAPRRDVPSKAAAERRREREHVDEFMDEAGDDEVDVDEADDEARPRLAPLTPTDSEGNAHA